MDILIFSSIHNLKTKTYLFTAIAKPLLKEVINFCSYSLFISPTYPKYFQATNETFLQSSRRPVVAIHF